MNMLTAIRYGLGFALGTLLFPFASAQEVGPPDRLFLDDKILHLTLEGPFNTIVRERPVETQYPATIRYLNEDDEEVEVALRIRARGNFRRNPENCRFPPIRLRFRAADVQNTVFEGLSRVPIVTHCQNSARYDQGILREYLAYKILSAVTDMSLGVRLLRVTYVDTEGRQRERDRFSFAIEHRNRLAERTYFDALDVPRTTLATLDRDYLNLTSVFQFLIGNTDFSPIQAAPGERCCHNHRLFGVADETPPQYSVPYDFDMTGIVNLPHSKPNPTLNLRRVTQRRYRGRCINNDLLPASLGKFQENREEILSLVDNLQGATSSTKSSLRNYIQRFYDVIDDPERVQRDLIDRCI